MYKKKDQLNGHGSYNTRIIVEWSIETLPTKIKENCKIYVNNHSKDYVVLFDHSKDGQ